MYMYVHVSTLNVEKLFNVKSSKIKVLILVRASQACIFSTNQL